MNIEATETISDWRKIPGMASDTAQSIEVDAKNLKHVAKKAERGDFTDEQAEKIIGEKLEDLFGTIAVFCCIRGLDFEEEVKGYRKRRFARKGW